MKLIILLIGLVGLALSAPLDDSSNAQIITYQSESIGVNDGYKFSYETSDGVKRTEEGVIQNAGTEQETLSVRGTISWVGPDGQTYTITFVADENGFQPKGEHLPK